MLSRARWRSPWPRALALAALALAAVASLSAGPAARAATRTYEIVFRAYCHTGTSCRWASDAALEAFWRRELGGVNHLWASAGVSFHVSSVTVVHEDTYAAIHNETDPSLELVQGLRTEASQDPTRIYMFLLDDAEVGWSAIPPWPDGSLYHYAIFIGDGFLENHVAHELGHHFCLGHTWSYQDPADQGEGFSHDGDGIVDTPPDPGPVEPQHVFPSGYDQGDDQAYVAGHDWCADALATGVTYDTGSYRHQSCTVACQAFDGASVIATGYAPKTSPLMSPWGACYGPYTVGGVTAPAFTPGEVQAIQRCITDIPERAAYKSLCVYDADDDGLCDERDPCPWVFDQDPPVDPDHDGISLGCDDCPSVANPDQSDLDGDGKGDACDGNMDGDACPNLVDLHPRDGSWPVGTIVAPACPDASRPELLSESVDSDGDGKPNCMDADDDDDGEPDDTDPCTILAHESGPEACRRVSPVACWEAVRACHPCGPEVIGRLSWVTDPSWFIDFHRISLDGAKVHLALAPGRPVAELARAFTGTAFGPGATRGPLRLALLDPSTSAPPLVLAELQPAALTLGALNGRALTVDLTDPEAPAVAASWTFAHDGGPEEGDADGDGVPDPADDCLAVADPRQEDGDGDGFGDACDPDLSGDGVVDAGDVAAVAACVGADLAPPVALPCGLTRAAVAAVIDAAALDRARACAAADLDGDGAVDGDDQARAEAALGGPPGPSGIGVAPEVDGGAGDAEAEAVEAAEVGPAPEAAEAEATGEVGSSDGCGCQSGGGPSADGLVAALAVGLALVARRRHGVRPTI